MMALEAGNIKISLYEERQGNKQKQSKTKQETNKWQNKAIAQKQNKSVKTVNKNSAG